MRTLQNKMEAMVDYEPMVGACQRFSKKMMAAAGGLVQGKAEKGTVNRKLCMETSKQSGKNQGDEQIIRTINGIANDQELMEKNQERNAVLGSNEGGWSNLERGCENIKGEITWIHGRISKNQSALKVKTDGGAKLGFGIDVVELNEVDFGLANVAIVSAYPKVNWIDYINTCCICISYILYL